MEVVSRGLLADSFVASKRLVGFVSQKLPFCASLAAALAVALRSLRITACRNQRHRILPRILRKTKIPKTVYTNRENDLARNNKKDAPSLETPSDPARPTPTCGSLRGFRSSFCPSAGPQASTVAISSSEIPPSEFLHNRLDSNSNFFIFFC